jgi:hypothetical protein
MNRQAMVTGGIALLIVAAVVSGILLSTRHNRLELTGEVLKVRSHQVDPEHTIVLVDMRVTNPSAQQFVVRDVEAFIEESDGKSTPAELFAEADIQRALGYYRVLGQKYNPGLLRKDKINSGESTDRSIAFSAPMTDNRFASRKAIRIVVHDVDRKSTELREKR